MAGIVAAHLLPQRCKSCIETAQKHTFSFCLIPLLSSSLKDVDPKKAS